MTTIGFIGLGNIGYPMAERLVPTSNPLIAFDMRADVLTRLVNAGALGAASPAAVGESADVVFLSLPTPNVVERVVLGEKGVAQGSRVRCIVDLSTTGPTVARATSAALRDKGIEWLDSPVSGGAGGARAGTLALMVSGATDRFEALKPYLAALGKAIYIGAEAGLGQTMKLVNNMLAGAALAITSEAMAMGAKSGIDPAVMIEALNAGSGRNTATMDKFPKSVLTGTFDYGFATALMHKDITLFIHEAEAMGLSLRASAAVRQLWFETLIEMGEHDFTTIAGLMEKRCGVSLRSHGDCLPQQSLKS